MFVNNFKNCTVIYFSPSGSNQILALFVKPIGYKNQCISEDNFLEFTPSFNNDAFIRINYCEFAPKRP